MDQTAVLQSVTATDPDKTSGYRAFTLGDFEFSRDAYFVTVKWPSKGEIRSHQMHADDFLRAMMRDVAWGFFYGWVNFDEVIGTRNHYGRVDMYAGSYNASFKEAGVIGCLPGAVSDPRITPAYLALPK